jgi:hypothetical protein
MPLGLRDPEVVGQADWERAYLVASLGLRRQGKHMCSLGRFQLSHV